ncbi:MAG: chromate transporter [Rikenellaceae bacterium]
MQKNRRYIDLFLSFAKIGVFTFGGGYAMIPLIEEEVIERRGWIEKSEFLDLLTIAQSIPGPLALNASAFVGYKTRGYVGAMTSIFGVVLPSFIILLLVALFFSTIRDNAIVVAAFNGMRPAVVALMAVPMFNLMKGVHPALIVISITTMFLMWWWSISPIYMIALAMIVSIVWSFKIKKGLKQ